jgi:two-component system, chemotaxis family, CheB/CheR fusion protein
MPSAGHTERKLRGDAEPLLAVIFEDIPRPAAAESEPVRDGENALFVQLENELRATQQDLQSVIEEQQASHEELRIANEEVISTNEELETSKEELQSVNEELTTVNSQLTTELNPPVLRQGSLTVILEWLAMWMHDMHGLKVKVVAFGREVLPENISFFLFRAVRELLFNVVKHAGVKAARVQPSRTDEMIQVVVEDQGAGFDPNDLGETLAFGLLSIRERLAVLGGSMEIDSAPSQGSRFKLLIPAKDL